MLKKLLKYEWKDTRKLLLPINLVILALTIIGCIMLNTSIFDTDMGFVFAIPLACLYLLSIIAFSSITIIYIYVRFYKNLFTREGYLMHTLPVTETQLFHAKFIVGFFWVCLNSMLTTISGAALGFAAGFHDAANELTNELAGEPVSLTDVFGYPLWIFLLWILLLMLAGSLYSVLTGYVSILLGQRMQKNKLAASIAFYFGIYFVTQTITALVTMVSSLLLIENTADDLPFQYFLSITSESIFLPLTALYLILSIIFYLVCRKLLKRNINLD